MATKTTYICDACDKEFVDDRKALRSVQLEKQPTEYSPSRYNNYDACKDCFDAIETKFTTRASE